MPLKSFSILAPFDVVMTMADVQEVESPLNFFYKVTFQNGYENVFTTFEGEEDEGDFGWNEAGLGVTQLAKDVGKAISLARAIINLIIKQITIIGNSRFLSINIILKRENSPCFRRFYLLKFLPSSFK